MKKHWKTLIFAAMTAAVLSCGVSAFAVSDVHATVYLDPVFVEAARSIAGLLLVSRPII